MSFLHIDPTDGVALYAQVVRQVIYAVASGALEPGERVPSVRELARDLAINPNTVSRAYRDLQQENILRSVRGTGLEVTQDAVHQCRQRRITVIRDRLRRLLRETRRSRLDPDELQRIWNEEFNALEAEENQE
jgi:GntR family transcriptional regulator